jgi:hypothetical protein
MRGRRGGVRYSARETSSHNALLSLQFLLALGYHYATRISNVQLFAHIIQSIRFRRVTSHLSNSARLPPTSSTCAPSLHPPPLQIPTTLVSTPQSLPNIRFLLLELNRRRAPRGATIWLWRFNFDFGLLGSGSGLGLGRLRGCLAR